MNNIRRAFALAWLPLQGVKQCRPLRVAETNRDFVVLWRHQKIEWIRSLGCDRRSRHDLQHRMHTIKPCLDRCVALGVENFAHSRRRRRKLNIEFDRTLISIRTRKQTHHMRLKEYFARELILRAVMNTINQRNARRTNFGAGSRRGPLTRQWTRLSKIPQHQ